MAAARRAIVLFFFSSFLSCPFFSGNSNVKSAKRRRIERVKKRGETKQGKGGSLIPVPGRITHVGGEWPTGPSPRRTIRRRGDPSRRKQSESIKGANSLVSAIWALIDRGRRNRVWREEDKRGGGGREGEC